MKRNSIIKNVILSILSVMALIGCAHDHDHSSSHSHSDEGESDSIQKRASNVQLQSENVASLTEAQINAVGITLGEIENKDLTATIKVNGILNVPNNNKGNATALFGGVIKTINVHMGGHVRKGQVIATITNPQFIQLQEEYVTIGSKILYAEQELRRQKELNEGNAGVLKNLQIATSELNSLRTRKASLHQQIQLMGLNPSSISNGSMKSVLAVTSPISGVVSNIYPKIGSYVDVSSPVAEIVDNASLHLDMQVFEKDLPKIHEGQIIHFTLTNNPVNEYDAKVFSIGSSFENESKTISVHCDVIGNKQGLIDGMNITGIVSLNDVTSPAVPNEAIVSSEGKDYIFVTTNLVPSIKNETDDHGHSHSHDEVETKKEPTSKTVNFERVEVVRGVSNVGYTAITIVKDIPLGSKIVTKGAFSINAKLSNNVGHSH